MDFIFVINGYSFFCFLFFGVEYCFFVFLCFFFLHFSIIKCTLVCFDIMLTSQNTIYKLKQWYIYSLLFFAIVFITIWCSINIFWHQALSLQCHDPDCNKKYDIKELTFFKLIETELEFHQERFSEYSKKKKKQILTHEKWLQKGEYDVRQIPHTAPHGCERQGYPLTKNDADNMNKSLPYAYKSSLSVTIIMPFRKEHNEVLKYTLESILFRTPPHLLDAIIVVDDANSQALDHTYATKEVVDSWELPKVVALRNKKREGLIRSRLNAAYVVSEESKMLVFLDSHIEVNQNWLEPLIWRAVTHSKAPNAIITPLIDILNKHQGKYKAGGWPVIGVIKDWSFQFTWKVALKKWSKPSDPFETPIMAGGLFIIFKDWFFNSGSYDEEMEIWGGENVEMSLRMWMCGGVIEINPCSRVGHIFRNGGFPYDFKSKVAKYPPERNTIRAIETWLDDESKNAFYIYRGGHEDAEFGNISKRLKLKKDLKCHDFQWFMDNIDTGIRKLMPSLHKKIY